MGRWSERWKVGRRQKLSGGRNWRRSERCSVVWLDKVLVHVEDVVLVRLLGVLLLLQLIGLGVRRTRVLMSLLVRGRSLLDRRWRSRARRGRW